MARHPHGAPTDFTRRVLNAVRRIPPGRVATYGDVARMAGRPRAWRAVGNIMRAGTAPDVPYHRVIAAGGRLGGYGGNVALKRALLRAEGLVVAGNRIRDFATVRLTPQLFVSISRSVMAKRRKDMLPRHQPAGLIR